MNKKKPLLTISLLSSGRQKTLRKCLDSIMPLMEKVDSELIIVDTGCDEETRAMMQVYTDQIIPFTWCDDFSKARNVGMSQAKGEWFMYLDDDEWFLDTKEIEDFFLSGDYKNYCYACYIQRNYMNYNRQIYTDAWVSRLVHLRPGVRFIGVIHEYFFPIQDPCKLLHSMVEHFGYIYSTKEEERQHIKRNTVLLQKAMKKEPNVIRWWIHLLQEYRAAEEFQQMQELCRDGIRHFRNFNDKITNRDRGSFYCGLVEAELLSAYYEQAEEDIKYGLKDKRNTQMCQMRLYNLGAEAYYKQKKYQEARECCEKYLEFYEILKDDEEERVEQEAFFVLNALEPAGLYSTLGYYILSDFYLGETKVFKKHFWDFAWDGVLMLNKGFIKDVVDFMSKLPYDEAFVKGAQTMVDWKGLTEFWDKVHEIENKAVVSAESEEQFWHLAKILSQVKSENHYVWYLRILYSDHIGEVDDLDTCYQKLFHYVADIFQLDDKIFAIAEKYDLDLGARFEEIPFDQWKLGIDSFFSNTSYEKILERAAVVERSIDKETENERLAARYQYFIMKTAEVKIVYGYSKTDFGALQECLQDFSDKCLLFYRRYFKENAFCGEMELLPAPCRAAVRFHQLLETQKTGDRQQIGDCLKQAVGVFKDFDNAVKAYAALFAEEEKAKLEAERAAQISPEMRALAGQIKDKIRALLAQGMAPEAFQVLQQLKTFIPDDPEITELEKEITLRFS